MARVNSPQPPLRHCAFYWSLIKGGEPLSDPAYRTARNIGAQVVRTYRTFDTEFEARGFAAAYDGEYEFLPMPETANEVYAPRMKAMPEQRATLLTAPRRTLVVDDDAPWGE